MHRFSVAIAAALLFTGPVLIRGEQPAVRKPAGPAAGFDLSVDSIMRGPDLVGWPPTGLRWSADSQKLYFDWRKPGEKESSTYVVGRDGGEPRKLSDDEVKTAPPATGRWDEAHRRVLFVDDGDVVLVDGTTGARRQITRTTGSESNPRWARHDSHITYVRDGNLFIVPVDGGGPALVTQLTDAGPKKTEPKLTDSQKFIRDEEERADRVPREQKERPEEGRGQAEEGQAAGVRAAGQTDRRRPDALARRHARVRPRGRTAGRIEEAPSCRTTSPSRATPRTFPAATTSATRRIAGSWRC